jgi:hypothetical protein
MANQVYANGRELACKAADGKTVSAFPDVCFMPPDKTPATPLGVPTPLPNTAFASDTTDGTKNIKITGKEIMLKDASCFKKSTGNEASKPTQKKGLVTSTEEGKAYFNSWSMDVKFEAANVVRHMDLTTHNHASKPGQTPPFPHTSKLSTPSLPAKPCEVSCPSEPTKEEYENVRSKTPTDEIRKSVNSKTPKACAACGNSADSLAADHIVSLKIISKIPGFACLSQEDKEKIANMPGNFVGLCKSCNSSKRDKTWHRWKGVKKRNLVFSDKVRDAARAHTNEQIVDLKVKVRQAPCKG